MMKRSELDAAVIAYRQTSLPCAPPNLSHDVWREIRLRQEAASPENGLDAFLAWFRAGGGFLAPSMVVLAIFISIGPVALGSRPTNNQEETRQALGLNVFSHEAYPLTKMAQNNE